MDPLKLDEGSELLVTAYEKQKSALNKDHRVYMGAPG